MARKRYNKEDILRLLREFEVHIHGSMDVVSANRTAGISDNTYYGCRKRYGTCEVI
jgi:putative transposase